MSVLTSTTWPVDSRVRLLNVPWDSAYRDVVAWESKDARDAWFEQRQGQWFKTNFQHLHPGVPITVPVPYSSAYKYNYLTITNPEQPVDDEGPERTYFYFITAMEEVSTQATRMVVQLDVMTTYAGDMRFGRAFVERGHIALANENARGDVTGAKLNTYLDLPEGLDVGSAYTPCTKEYIPVIGPETAYGPKIIIISTADLAADPGSESSPALNVADGQFADGLPSGCNVYWVSLQQFKPVMQAMKNKSWAAQCIVAIYAFPGRLLSDGPSVKLFGNGPEMHFIGNTDSLTEDSTPYWTTRNVYEQLRHGLGTDTDLNKLLCYPYSVIELSTLTGNPVFLKPQLVEGNALKMFWIGCALAPFAKVGFFPRNYGDPNGNTIDISYTYRGFEGDVKSGVVPGGDFLDTAVWLTDFPQFSLVNNNYLTYLASTVHTRNYQYQSAGWAKDRANMAAQNTFGNTQRSIQSAQEQWDRSAQGFASNVAQQMWSSPVFDTGDSQYFTFTQTPSLANITNTLTGGASLAGWNADNAVQNATGAGSLQARLQGQSDIADNNLSLAQRAAQGDYENDIAGINATVQDAALTPPSTVGQSGGQGFNWKNGLVGIVVTYKTLSGAARAAVSDYFRRYGYAVRRFLPLGTVPHMLCMSKFAYWKCKETNLTCANANESERETMRGIVEKGVTLWDAPESIGNTDLSANQPKSGYAY
jgi:hypothetical protein